MAKRIAGDAPRGGRVDPEVCARCATVGHCCCVLSPGQEELCFPVSEMERQRIVESGPGRAGLCPAPNSEAFLGLMARLFPRDRTWLGQVFPARGRHLRLATRPDGRCVYLAESGCRLPREARPYYCRLFPFWVSAGAVAAFEAKGCLALKQGRTVPGMLAVLGVSQGAVRELHGRMRLAWGLVPDEDLDAAVLSRP